MPNLISNHLILVNVCSDEEFNFFRRFLNAGSILGYRFVFLTYRYHVYTYAKKCLKADAEVFYLTDEFCRKDNEEKNLNLDLDLECLTNSISLKGAYKCYNAAMAFFETLNKSEIDYIWCWNGYKIIDHALKDFAKRNCIKTLYFEIANIKGKLFVDSKGTNCRSYLYLHKEILNKISLKTDEYLVWRNKYIAEKFQQTTIPQAKKIRLLQYIQNYTLDFIGYMIHNGIVQRKIPIRRTFKRFHGMPCDLIKEDIRKINYIFFPLQVSTDTQVLINGNITVLNAVKKALDYARNHNFYLVIKPHPAEKNPLYFEKLESVLSNYNRTLITNENTFKLIKYAQETFTINSTVGLEAKILNRPVHVFGKALYENFTQDDISRYVMGYLLNIDYWGTDNISIENFKKVLERTDLKVD